MQISPTQEKNYTQIIQIGRKDHKYQKQSCISHIPNLVTFQTWVKEKHPDNISTLTSNLLKFENKCIRIFPISGSIHITEISTHGGKEREISHALSSDTNCFLCYATHSRFKVTISALTKLSEAAIFTKKV